MLTAGVAGDQAGARRRAVRAGGLGRAQDSRPVPYPLGWGSCWQFLYRVVRSLTEEDQAGRSVKEDGWNGGEGTGSRDTTEKTRGRWRWPELCLRDRECGGEQRYEDQRGAAVSVVLRTKLAQMPPSALGRTLDMWIPVGELILLKRDYLIYLVHTRYKKD